MLAIFYETVNYGAANTSGTASNCHYYCHDNGFACEGENVKPIGSWREEIGFSANWNPD